MQGPLQRTGRPKRRVGFVKRIRRIAGAVLSFLHTALYKDMVRVWKEGRLFVGLGLLIVGLLSFASDRYCDGTVSSHYACTRPTTYYYYPWWSIALVLVGAFLITLWLLRRTHPR